MHPGVAAAAVLDVPFLDVLGDMSDPGLPLTIKERGEWGDPLESKVRGFVCVNSWRCSMQAKTKVSNKDHVCWGAGHVCPSQSRRGASGATHLRAR
jgi:hypothetical protein